MQTFVIVAAAVGLLALLPVLYWWRKNRAQHSLGVHLINAMASDATTSVIVVDLGGSITFVNHAGQALLSRSAGQVVGTSLHRALHDLEERSCPAAAGKQCPLDEMLDPPDGANTGHVTLPLRSSAPMHLAYSSCSLVQAGKRQGVAILLRDVTEQVSSMDALREWAEQHHSVVQASPDGILVTDALGFVTMANARAVTLFGVGSPDDLVGKRVVDLVAQEDRSHLLAGTRALRTAGDIRRAEYRVMLPDGRTIPIEMRTTVMRNTDGQPAAFIHACTDTVERHRAEKALQMRELGDSICQAASVALAHSAAVGDAALNVLQAVGTTAGWDAGAFWTVDASQNVLRCLTVWHASPETYDAFFNVTRELILSQGDDVPGLVWATRQPAWEPNLVSYAQSGRALVASHVGLHAVVGVPIRAHSQIVAVLEFLSEEVRVPEPELLQAMQMVGDQLGHYMERRSAEQALEHQAYHDALTGLPNRLLLRDRLDRAIRVASGQDRPLSMLLLDLDRFKAVNDTLGHRAGDLLLQEVGERLQRALRDCDTAARLGGDEFAVLLPGADALVASQVAEKISAAITRPHRLAGHTVDVGTSIGIAVYPEHGRDGETLMQRSDIAMYAAKRTQSGYAVYDTDQDEYSPEHLTLFAELRQAIEQGRLSMYYQPKANLKSGRIESVETLVRWHHPSRGLLLPEQFIPLAERSGLIRQLTYFVLDQSLHQCAEWRRNGMTLGVAVNLSADNLRDAHLVEIVRQYLDDCGLEADCLTLEVTESSVMMDSRQALNTLHELDEMGVRISIDDFGTGYSSLMYLKRLPVQEIKIEKAFVLGLVEHDDDAFIIRSVIELGHSLGLDVVAEGVESSDAWGMLETMGCDEIQGFYLTQPLPAAEMTAWLQQASWETSDPNRITRLDSFQRTKRSGA